MTQSTMTVDGVYTNLATIGDFVEKIAVQAGFDSRSVYAVQMAVDEACSNIIEHGYGGEGKGKIYLLFEQSASELRVTIQDQGTPFDPDLVPEPDIHAPIEERPEGGLGLFLMYQLMDEVKFVFSGGEKGDTNTLVMIKRLAGSTPDV